MVAPTERRERSTSCGVRKPDLAHLGRHECTADHPPHIASVMGPKDFLIGRRMRLAQRLTSGQACSHHALAQK
jgi:hypothetical protein